jgi:phosphate-selective porin OprO/OprP
LTAIAAAAEPASPPLTAGLDAVVASLDPLDPLPLPVAMPLPGPEPVAMPPPPAAPQTHLLRNEAPLTARWRNGLELISPAGDFRLHIGGRAQADASGFTAGPGPNQPPDQGGLNPPVAGAVNMRRGRVRTEFQMYEFYEFAAEYDFVNQLNAWNEIYPQLTGVGPNAAVKDLYLQVGDLPVLGTVRIGNQKDPYGLEHLTDSRWLEFMERSYSMDAFEGPFNDGYLPGVQLSDSAADGRVAWYLGEFANVTNPFGFTASSGGSVTVGRLVILPIFEDEGRRLLHLGVAGRTMQPQRRQLGYDAATGAISGPTVPAVRFRSRGSVRNGPPGPLNSIYADSGLLIGEWQNMLGLELAASRGPFSVQGEYFGSWLYDARTPSLAADGFENGPANAGLQPPPGTPLGTVFYQGGYLEAIWFLTGETRTYLLEGSRFGRPIPRRNFYRVRDQPRNAASASGGAWQAGVRYNYLCLNDGEVDGGVLNGMTFGLIWLLNPQARLYFNYDFTARDYVNLVGDDASGNIHAFGTRLAFDF